jgi:predicted ATP-binding protein involved in virulence
MENIADLHEQVYAHLTTKYPDLTFSLRQDDRYGALEAGYWFEGDENEIRFTFFKSDVLERPLVFLKIRIDRNELLLCVDGNQDTTFSSSHWHTLRVDFLKKVTTNYESRKVLERNNYYEFLLNNSSLPFILSFVAALHYLIDENAILQTLQSFIERKENFRHELFYRIPQSDFQKSKELIEKYRKPRQNKVLENQEMAYIEAVFDNLTCRNIKHIESASIDFHKNATCFIGMNGMGKTTILQAIALAAIGNDKNNAFLQKVIQQNKVEKFLKMTEKNREPHYAEMGEISLAYQYNKENYKNTIALHGRERKSTVSNASDADFKLNYSDAYLNTLIIAFPQLKGAANINDSDVKDKFPNLYDCSSLINGEADNRAAKIERWFFSLYNEALNQGAKQGIVFTNTHEYKTLNFVFEILSAIFNQKIEIHDTKYYGSEELTWLKIDDKIVLMSLLSQGYENVMVWIGYIVKRLYEIQANTPYDNLVDIPAIVLIDEIDTYLHISVQQKILAVLVEKFPNIQFIVTTHSPYTIGSIPNDKIKIYVCKKEGESVEVEEFNDFTPYGADVERLSEMLGLAYGTRPQKTQNTLNHITNLIAENKLDAAEQAIEDLKNDKSFGLDANDPALVQQEMFLETKKMWAAE